MQKPTEKPLKGYSCFYKASMSPALGRSSALQCVEVGDAFEIHNGIIFNFYPELPCMSLCLLPIPLQERYNKIKAPTSRHHHPFDCEI